MAEGYQTEDEQVEALKKWWRENGRSTITTVVVALVAVFGWQGWQKKQQDETEAASAIYQNLLTATNAQKGEVSPEQRATANHLAETLKKDFPKTTYAQFAALYKARFAVAENDLANAEQELRWVLAGSDSAEIAAQAQLRLARVLYAQDKFDEALSSLEKNTDAGLSAEFEEVKGDVYLARGDKKQASLAYQKSRELSLQSKQVQPNPLLDMKIQQLESAQQAVSPGSDNSTDSSEGDA